MSTQLEEQVEREQQEYEQGQEIEGHERPDEPESEGEPEDGALFDRSQYDREDLAIAKIDGEQIDRIAVKFAGTVFLDRSDPNDVALYNQLKLGRDVTLNIEGKCSGTAAKGATDRDGDLDVIVGERSVKVHTVYRPAGAVDEAEPEQEAA
jgi:hypothetical protein